MQMASAQMGIDGRLAACQCRASWRFVVTSTVVLSIVMGLVLVTSPQTYERAAKRGFVFREIVFRVNVSEDVL